ncbi:hypothetical protein AURDEDRAFT_170884 [Auricularia subglabra TFB-10046 SS5]|nr:hypothetical protein AURDEDRAFT_170884 [Auricularia subglabra TFB-10046 SS5]
MHALVPIQHAIAWRMFKALEATFWTAEDLFSPVKYEVPEYNVEAAYDFTVAISAVRAAALPEKMSALLNNAEYSRFFTYQAMQENVHVEAATRVAGRADRGGALPPIVPLPPTPIFELQPAYQDVYLPIAEYAAVLAGTVAKFDALYSLCGADYKLRELVHRVATDFDRFYRFALHVCALAGLGPHATWKAYKEATKPVVYHIVADTTAPNATNVSDICDAFFIGLSKARDDVTEGTSDAILNYSLYSVAPLN